ncbi:MAG: LuxR family transcriptional regulator [Burkholderiaceae bacterium]|nr:LuxR family transcriptional regulator [Burkholderiaceae bacterium]
MLQGDYQLVLEAQSLDQFRSVVIGFAQRLGFDKVSAMVAVDRLGGPPEFVAVHNAPLAYLRTFEDLSVSKRDPIAQHCKRNTVPIIWGQHTYLQNNAIDQWEHQAHYGYRNGIAMALHLPEGRHFLLGVDRDQALPTDGSELTRIVADLQLFAVHAQDTALRVLVSADARPEMPELTPRELEVLCWTMDGLTTAEISTQLGIGERTTVFHIQNAMLKLHCNSKHVAVVKALRLGLIQ